MHIQEKLAWVTVVFTAGPLILFLSLFCAGAGDVSVAAFALVAPLGVASFFGRRKKGGAVTLDERDNWIAQKATMVSFGFFWIGFVLLCMMPYVLHGPTASVTLRTPTLQMILWGSACSVWLLRAVIVIYFYRRDRYATTD